MNQAEREVPLYSIGNYQSDGLTCKVNLPEFISFDHTHFNAQRIKTFARIAGLDNLYIYSEPGEVSEYEFNLDRINADGTAVMDASHEMLVHKAVLSSGMIAKHEHQEYEKFSDFSWGDGIIKVNSSELNDRVLRLADKYKMANAQHLWSLLLNEVIADGIYQVAKENLAGDNVSPLNRAAFWATMSELGLFSVLNESFRRSIESKTIYSLGVLALDQAMMVGSSMIFGKNSIRDWRWSLIPGYQLDRILLARIIPKLLPVVTVNL